VAISGERIAGLGRYEGIESVDVSGLIMLPGFLDAHMHLESTKLTPAEFARAALPWGTTTVVADPPQDANVLGLEGSAAIRAPAPGPANCLQCTDDREPDELVATGHINGVVRKAVTLGIPPADAVTMATLSAARYHRLLDRGAVAPGLLADVIAVRDLAEFRPV